MEESAMDLNSSIEPLRRWMCLIGVYPPPVNGFCCGLYYFYQAFCFLLVVLIQSSTVIHIFRNARTVSSAQINVNSTTALSWNFIIDNTNFALYAITGHGFLLLLTRPRMWTDLINSFELLDKNLPSLDIYPRCRQLTFIAIVYIIASVLRTINIQDFHSKILFSFFQVVFLEITFGLDVIPGPSSTIRKILDISGYFNKFYPATALALFCIIVRVHALQFASIQQRIERIIDQRNISPSQISQLKLLRRHHSLVCSSVNKVNRYFGVFLLLEVIFIFIGVTNCFMYVLMSAMSIDGLLGAVNTIICVDHIIHLFLLTSFSDDIFNEVIL